MKGERVGNARNRLAHWLVLGLVGGRIGWIGEAAHATTNDGHSERPNGGNVSGWIRQWRAMGGGLPPATNPPVRLRVDIFFFLAGCRRPSRICSPEKFWKFFLLALLALLKHPIEQKTIGFFFLCMSDAFDAAWGLLKMAWKPDSIEWEGLWGDEQGPLNEPLDAGLYKPIYALRDPNWYHENAYKTTGQKKNQWHRHHDQDWALNPFITEQGKDRGGKWIQVDRMMKPLLEALWAKGISTKFSDVGGDLRENPLYQYNDILDEKSIFRGREKPLDSHEGYLWFGSEGIPEQARHFRKPRTPKERDYGESAKTSPYIDLSRPTDGRNPEGETIRWAASDNLSNLRQLYDAFDVAFPDEYMKDGGYQWR